MSEEGKKISVTEFMGAIEQTGRIASEKKDSQFHTPTSTSAEPEDVILLVNELGEEEQEEIEKELKKQESQVDVGDLPVKSLIGVLPLEPVIVMVTLGESEHLGDMKSVGVPGFINPNSGEFFLLDGSVPDSISLREKVKEYVENRR